MRPTDPQPAFAAEALTEHVEFLRALARRLVRDEHAALDLAQDALVAGLESGDVPVRGWRGWLAGAARHRAVDLHRERRGRERRERERASTASVAPDAASIEAQLEGQRALAAAVAALSDPYREAIYLRFYEELPPRRIAARLGLPVETVKTRLVRALDQLRAQLDARHDGRREHWSLALAALVRRTAPPRGPAAWPVLLAGAANTPLGWTLCALALALVTWGLAAGTAAPRPTGFARPAGSDVALASSEGADDLARDEAVVARVAADPQDATPAGPRGWTLAGRVVDERGAALPATAVEVRFAYERGFRDARDRIVLSTDARGRFEHRFVLPPEVSSHAHLLTLASARTADGRTGSSELLFTDPRRVPHGSELSMDVQVTDESGGHPTASGRVVDRAGRPLVGVPIALRAPGESFPPAHATDLDGRFRIVLEPAPESGRWPERLVPARFEVGSAVQGAVSTRAFDPRAARRTELGELVLEASGRLEGTVLTPDGAPVAGLRFGVLPGDEPDAQRWAGPRLVTDAEGRFVVTGVVPGRYWLRTEGLWLGLEPVLLGPVDTGAVTNLRFDVRLLTVRVVDEAGRGVPAVTLRLARGQRASMKHTEGARAEARFAVQPGRYTLIASVGHSQEDRWEPSAPDAVWSVGEVVVGEGDHQLERELVLDFGRPRGALRVKARDATGAPVQESLQLRMSLEGMRDELFVLRADELGVARGVPAGTYTVAIHPGDWRATGATHLPARAGVLVRGGETTELDVVLARGGRLELDVDLTAGAEDSLRVELEPLLEREAGGPPARELMTAEGAARPFRLWLDERGRSGLLGAGAYELRVGAAGHVSDVRRVDVLPGAVTPVSLRLLPE